VEGRVLLVEVPWVDAAVLVGEELSVVAVVVPVVPAPPDEGWEPDAWEAAVAWPEEAWLDA
jgi:hypothetical protein